MFKLNIRLLLKAQKKDKLNTYPIVIYQLSPISGKQVVKYTGLRISKSHWDTKFRRIKTTYIGHELMNRQLAAIVDLYKNAYLEILDQFPDLEQVHEYLQKKKTPEALRYKVVPGKKMIDALKEYQVKFEKSKSADYLRGYNQTIFHLEKFEPEITVEKFDGLFWIDFKTYLASQQMRNSTANQHLKRIKSAMKYFAMVGYKISPDFMMLKSKENKKSRKFGLRIDELIILAKYEPINQTEKITLDQFLLACGTGLRIGEIHLLSKSMIHDFDYIHFVEQEKNNEPRIIFLSDFTLPIINRWYLQSNSSLLFPPLTGQEYNRTIKEIAEKAGLDRVIEKVKRIGVERIVDREPLWKLISSHIARHTFTTIIQTENKNISTTRDIVGHENISTTANYSHVDNDIREIVKKAFKAIK